MTLDEIPIKNLVLIMEDDSNIHLLGQPTKVDNIKLWEKLQEDYQERNPSVELKQLIREHKKLLRESIEFNKNICLLNFLIGHEGEEREFFEAAGIPYIEDPIKRMQHLKKQVDKSKQLIEIYTAKLKKREDEIKERRENTTSNKLSIKQLNKSLAAMEMNGATIPDYSTFTYGQYEAWNEVLIEKSRKNAS
ncbi:hypothetical protein [Flagellimonas flava]|uniref:hypothetical protein n=1 Tax=Flagellimonas flava TaxID=570519 RepID=UPI003D6505D4